MMKQVFIILTLLVLLCCGMGSKVFAATKMADLENALMCKCDDKCGKVLINCTCDTSKKTRKDLAQKLESGLTVEQIIQTYVDKYGETVLSAPSKSGFNLTAWVTPFLALVIGGVGVRKIAQNWIRKSSPSASIDKESTAENIENENSKKEVKYSNRLKKELDNLEF